MSSTYITSSDMQLIEQLLVERHETHGVQTIDKETEAARELFRTITCGISDEETLRIVLANHFNGPAPCPDAARLSRWESEGGAVHRLAQT